MNFLSKHAQQMNKLTNTDRGMGIVRVCSSDQQYIHTPGYAEDRRPRPHSYDRQVRRDELFMGGGVGFAIASTPPPRAAGGLWGA